MDKFKNLITNSMREFMKKIADLSGVYRSKLREII